MKQHKHAKLLETIVPHRIQIPKDTIHLYKVKSHAGILGNECADAIANCSAENKVAMISTLTPTPIPILASKGGKPSPSLPTWYS
jgi:ribonuclease HI